MDFFQKNKTLLIVIIAVCAIIIMWGRSQLISRGVITPGVAALFGKKAEEGVVEEVIPVKVTQVVKMDYKDTITSFGTIKGFGEIPIRFKESGAISKFYLKDGDAIKKDELVVSQDQEEEKLKFEYAQIEYDKNKTLYELGAITKDKFRQAELELESAELDLKKRNFYAPADGFMGTRNVNEGELVEPNDTVATFLDINNVFCEIGIIEKDIDKVKVGQDVKVVLDTFPDDAFAGIVDSVSPMIEGRSRTQTVRILISNERYFIKPGMFARAEITIFEKKDALVVPKKALKKTEEGHVVFGVIRDKKMEETTAGFELATAKAIAVVEERATEKLALVSEGLDEGQEIILESPRAKEAIKDGARIEIIGVE
jgi:membrane fusion protein (multidrug efflux system)